MRILLLTSYFDPEPTPKGLAFARELVRQGFEVEVVTGYPSYPGGRIYPGYRMRLLQREIVDGVHITRVPLYPSHDSSAIRRVMTYVTIAWSFLIYGLFVAKKPDVIYAYHPPLTVGFVAVLLCIFRRAPVIYDIQDMWPDTLKAVGMLTSERLLAFVGRVCKWVYQRVDRIVVLSPGFKKLLIERGVASDKVDVIYNWCDAELLVAESAALPAEFPDSSRFRIVFAGNIGRAQGLDAVLGAAQQLEQTHSQVTFVFVGGGAALPNLRAKSESMGIGNVVFLPQMPLREVGVVLRAADALLVHLKDDPLFAMTVPSKTQAYMAVGRPIIMGVRGDAADLVEDAGCGLITVPENPDSIVAAVDQLCRMTETERARMGARGMAYYQARLSLAAGCKSFGRIFREVGSP